MGMPFPRLDRESLVKGTKVRGADLSGPADEAFAQYFQLLVDDANNAADLNFLGRIGIQYQLKRLLRNRFLARRWIADHPETLDVDLNRPLFVVGQARTGTTMLYALLAQDPHARAPKVWELAEPVPPTDPAVGRDDPRHREIERQQRNLHRYLPGLLTAHATAADDPQECFPLLETTALSSSFLLYYDMPSFWARLCATSREEAQHAYAEFRHQIQILQTHGRGRRWVSKSPAHLYFLDMLLETFPGSGVVMTHREPLESIPSLCSLMAIVRSASSDNVDPAVIGKRAFGNFQESCRRAVAARAKVDAGRIIDFTYPRLVEDPIGAVRTLYDHFGYEYTPGFEQRMQSWLADNPQHKHGVHRYTLEQFGLDRDEVFAATDDYRRRYL